MQIINTYCTDCDKATDHLITPKQWGHEKFCRMCKVKSGGTAVYV